MDMLINKTGDNQEVKDITVALRPFRCEECDYESCEYLLWCKEKNTDKET